MKNGRGVLLLVCALSFCIVLGIFIGRNLRDEFVPLPQNSMADTVYVTEATEDLRLNINTASKAQLMELPGIGEIIADRIIIYRTENGPFQTIDDLMNVDGIGLKKIQQLESLIRAGG